MATIWVRFTAEGWHHWPGAPEHRAYLGVSHRHLFHVRVEVPVSHDQRDIEFHDLLDTARELWGDGDHQGRSCETLARELGEALVRLLPVAWVEVEVSEDGEAGATVKAT